MTDAASHHDITYVELTVTDMAKAQSFYSAAFGWSFTEYGPGYAGFRTAHGTEGADTAEAGGLLLADAAQPVGGPFVLLYSDDLDATIDAIRSAGGGIAQGPYAFPGGRRVHFTDPSGNELGVWSAH